MEASMYACIMISIQHAAFAVSELAGVNEVVTRNGGLEGGQLTLHCEAHTACPDLPEPVGDEKVAISGLSCAHCFRDLPLQLALLLLLLLPLLNLLSYLMPWGCACMKANRIKELKKYRQGFVDQIKEIMSHVQVSRDTPLLLLDGTGLVAGPGQEGQAQCPNVICCNKLLALIRVGKPNPRGTQSCSQTGKPLKLP
eukprot:1151312-Pelagomonas_calceolata.AAC.8